MIRFRPIERALFDEQEAAAYLRLAHDGETATASSAALNRLVDQKKLRPCVVGGKRRYSRRELDRFIDAETQRYGPARD